MKVQPGTYNLLGEENAEHKRSEQEYGKNTMCYSGKRGEREYCTGDGKNQEGFQEEVAFEQNYVELHVILTAKIGNSLYILDINPLSDV